MTAAFLIVTTTVEGPGEAKSLARSLVEERLAACVQTLPIESAYRWQGAVATASEHLLICKIRATDYPAVEKMIQAKHAYEVPEIVAVPIVTGSTAYLAWLTESTAG